MARQRGTSWQADVRQPDGGRLRPTFGTQAEAEAWEAEARRAIRDGRPVPQPGTGMAGKRDLSSLGSLFDHVARTRWAGMKAGRTMTRNANTAVQHFGRNWRVAEIDAAAVDDYAAALADRGLAKGTVNRKLAALSRMLKTAEINGAIQRRPAMPWRKEAKTRFRYLDAQEERALLAYWTRTEDHDLHDLCLFLIDTGARCYSEAIPLRWEDVTARAATFWDTKTNRPRSVPITLRCREMVARRRQSNPGGYGPFAGINRHTMRHRWDAMRQFIGWTDVTPHTLRHTCATRLVHGGADIRRIMEWMGHSAIVTTMRYLQLRPRSLEDIVGILEPAESPEGLSHRASAHPHSSSESGVGGLPPVPSSSPLGALQRPSSPLPGHPSQSSKEKTISTTTPKAFDAETALATARLFVRTAWNAENPSDLCPSYMASACQIVGDGYDPLSVRSLFDPLSPALDAAMANEERRVRAALPDHSPADDVLDAPGAYPIQTGANLAMVGLALPRAWELEEARQPALSRAAGVLDAYLHRALHEAAASIWRASTASPAGA